MNSLGLLFGTTPNLPIQNSASPIPHELYMVASSSEESSSSGEDSSSGEESSSDDSTSDQSSRGELSPVTSDESESEDSEDNSDDDTSSDDEDGNDADNVANADAGHGEGDDDFAPEVFVQILWIQLVVTLLWMVAKYLGL